MLRRAAAAKLLYETLARRAEAMRRALRGPAAGGHRTPGTARVRTDAARGGRRQTWQVVSRTVDGVNRVACATEHRGAGADGAARALAAASMVSKDGGVPWCWMTRLDSTDEGRLESMGAVLRIASQDMQTIILTCAPERYVHVGAQVSTAM